MYSVMIVEDESIIRNGIVSIVDRFGSGLSVEYECSNAYDAWEQFNIAPPDIVITDIVMKGMTGLELLQKIREAGSNVPVIILSGYSDFYYAQEAIRYNVTEYALKPLNVKQFVSVLMKIKEQLDRSNISEQDEGTEAEEITGKRSIRRTVEYIRDHLDGDLSLPTVAVKVGLSTNYLSMLFRSEMNEKYSDYVTKLRIEKACHLLQNTDFKIYEIAELCGYNSVNHFIGVFKKCTGYTPSGYKNRH